MSTRLLTSGRLIDRSRPLRFEFNGRRMSGFAGDTLASALLANGRTLVGRSFKYHRPRGIVASGPEEPNALMTLGRGARLEPNQRATTTELVDGLFASSQNHWPSLHADVGAINTALARFLPAGFYYKMFIHPRALWKHLFEPFIRHSAGLGRAPERGDVDRYDHVHAHFDVVIVGGGIAGIAAALALAGSGKRMMLMEQTAHWGGRAPVDGALIDGRPAGEWIDAAIARLAEAGNVTLRLRCMGAGVYDHGYVLACERLGEHGASVDGPRHRLWRLRAGQVVTATGAIERPLAFAGNDLPGVMLASAVRDYLVDFAVAPGDRVAIVTNNDDAYRTAIEAKRAGLDVPVIVDARPLGGGALMQQARGLGIRVETGAGIARVRGLRAVRAIELCRQAGGGTVTERVACDVVAMSGGWSPVVHLWSHCGGKLVWDEDQAHFRPDPDRPPTGADGNGFVTPVGSAAGPLDTPGVLASAQAAARRLGGSGDAPTAEPEDVAPMRPVWIMPDGAPYALRAKSWLDFQHDVKVTDVQLAAQEGFESVEHAKRYTTLGMATDQGKLSNINGLAILAGARALPIPQVGTTTFRPPYAPISMGVIAGEARDELFQPLRRTPLHDWHEANGAEWEPVGHWRRPFCYRQGREDIHQAVPREVVAVRNSLGLLDASTLGKIVVKGPDAGQFLDMLYTNLMSSLPVGRCRYGLMCNENGFLVDDGVVARLDETTWLCHTTTGGADRIHAHMEEWLQTEWWNWKVFTANLTEHYAQIAVVGPKARAVLERLGGLDVSREALPFMTWAEGTLAGIAARVFRISFSGELSYEIAVAAGQGRALWEALLEAGAAFDVTPYGTEALHILRAEKGFIMIGDETDGTVIPQDLGLDWAISKKKGDYLGKRAHARKQMTDPERWKLVGLETLDGSVLPEGAHAVAPGHNVNGQRHVQGRVTSTYHSPTLDRGIAMGLVRHGPARMGEILEFAGIGGKLTRARIVDPVRVDKTGEKQDA